MGEHIVDGKFQSDKYPTCPNGKVPLSTSDPLAQDLLWEYAQRRREIDPDFSTDLVDCLIKDGFIYNEVGIKKKIIIPEQVKVKIGKFTFTQKSLNQGDCIIEADGKNLMCRDLQIKAGVDEVTTVNLTLISPFVG